MFFKPKTHVIVIINEDGTGRVHYVSSPPSQKEKILHAIFLNMMQDGDFSDVTPGRYKFQVAKIGFPRFQYDLIPID